MIRWRQIATVDIGLQTDTFQIKIPIPKETMQKVDKKVIKAHFRPLKEQNIYLISPLPSQEVLKVHSRSYCRYELK